MISKYKVLIVEDLPSDAELDIRETRKVLGECVFEVVETETDFVDKLTNFQPDIILSDYNMPNFNGLSALRITLELSPITPLIIVTGSVNEDTAVECMKAGASNYVIKEQIKRLGPAITHALEEKKIKQENINYQNALIESERRYRSLFELSPLGMCLMNDKGIILEVSDNICKMVGYSKEELIGQSIQRLTLPQDYSCVEDDLNVLLNGNILKHYVRNVCKDGSIIDVELNETSIVLSDGSRGIMSIVADITERKKAEETLKIAKEQAEENEAKFRAYIEHSPDGVFLFDSAGIISDSNPSASEISGYSRKEILSMTVFELFVESEHERVLNSLLKLKKSGNFSGEMEFIRKDGSSGIAIIEAVKLAENKILGFAKEITERKRIENELIAAKEAAEESNRLKSAFLATMSHELRTPLNAIIGFSGIMGESMTPEEIQNISKIINTSGNHLLSIIEAIFELSLLQSGERDPVIQDVSVYDLFTSLKSFLKTELLKNNKQHLRTEFVTTALYPALQIQTDKTKLTQLLTNLLGNAVKYTEKGIIECGYSIKNESITFYVKDTGIGIPPYMKDVIFERFRQVDDTHTRKQSGVGLGLAICKEISVLLNGRMWLESVENEGSVFYFELPCVIKSVQSGQTSNGGISVPDFNGKTILIVEDNESNFYLIKSILKATNANIIWALNGEDAVEQVRELSTIDLILMDIRMPGMNGYDATRMIKQEYPDIPVVAQTAYALRDDREKAIEAGCDDYISKPFSRTDLLDVVRKYICAQQVL